MSKEPILLPIALGDAICTLIEQIAGEPIDIVLMVGRRGGDINENWSRPTFLTSLHPDVMEAVLISIGEGMAAGLGGRRIVIGEE